MAMKTSFHLRRQARACALQILYQMDCGAMSVEAALENFWDGKTVAKSDVRRYAETLVKNVAANLAGWDAVIEPTLRAWKKERLACVDINILRLAAAEYAAGGVPRKVVMNEAIELAKRFGAEQSSRFVNGVLEKILLPAPLSPPPSEPFHESP